MRGYFFPIGDQCFVTYVEGLVLYSFTGKVYVFLYQIDADISAPKVVCDLRSLAAAVERVKNKIILV